ncbi:MAG TPA: cell division protein ZipA C-terminal FtsZ-binding domain-containing protein [Steroidobacteraceae bacterium]|nr:cell division protein ZipA C-terminal FtsZ-binding domain-containing protein [Steroidobacteraceae bacterium]
MAELRWILLLAGLVFLAGLTAWEMRRPRQGRGGVGARERTDRNDRHEPTLSHAGDMETPSVALAAAVPSYATVAAPRWNVPAWDTPERDHDEPPRPARESREARVPLEDPIHIDLPPHDASEQDSSQDLPVESPLVVSFDEPLDLPENAIPTLVPREAFEITDARHYEHRIIEAPYEEPPHEVPTLHAAAGQEGVRREAEALEEAAFDRAAQEHDGVRSQPTLHAPAYPDACPDEHPGAGSAAELLTGRLVEDTALPCAEPIEPIVDWPPETQRHILAVRVVGVNPDRMAGRPLRQALSACGFVHGRFGIFHQPGADGRALVSAANLSKPGVFDPTSMDFQRFRGLGLFAVLPGPLPPAAAFDHLLDTAADLAQRLHARLQDEHGMPLDEERLEAMARIVQDMTQGLRAEPAA